MAAAVTGEGNKGRWLTVALLAPTTAWFLIMLVMPLIVVAVFSFGERSPKLKIATTINGITNITRNQVEVGASSATVSHRPLLPSPVIAAAIF